jgi:hypothetical protein
MGQGKFNKKTVEQAVENFRNAKKELELIMDYPPFCEIEYSDYGKNWGLPFASDTGEKLINEFHKELKRITDLTPQEAESDITLMDPDIFSEPFKNLQEKFSDELETARLWQKRFPNNWVQACKKSAKPDFKNE